MKQVQIFRKLNTRKPREEVLEIVEQAFRRVGGALTRTDDTFTIRNGSVGVNMAFAADIYARVVVRQKADGVYEIDGVVSQSPNAAFWVCLIVGFFCLWFLWIVNLLYLMVDVQPAYQAVVDRIAAELTE